MTMREKMLAAAVAAMVLLWGGNRMWNRYNASIAVKRTQLIAAQERLGEAKLAFAQGEAAMSQLDDWQSRSLPANREAAQSLYRVWLETQLKAAGLTVEEFQPLQRLTPAVGYSAVGYTVNAHGPLKSLTNFLHEYYRSNLLQQITRLQLRPDMNPAAAQDLAADRSTDPAGHGQREAARGCRRADGETGGDRLRNVDRRAATCSPSTARRAPSRRHRAARDTPPPPKFDDAKFAYFTATIQVDGRYQAWIHIRTTNETLRLFEGRRGEGRRVRRQDRLDRAAIDRRQKRRRRTARRAGPESPRRQSGSEERKPPTPQTAAPVSRAFFTPTNDICDLRQV